MYVDMIIRELENKMKKIKASINGRYNNDGSAVVGEIRISEKAVTLMIPEAYDYYGVTKKACHKTYPLADVEKALSHDGWESLEEIEKSEHMNASYYLANRI